MGTQNRDRRRLVVLDDEDGLLATPCMMATTAAFETDHTGTAELGYGSGVVAPGDVPKFSIFPADQWHGFSWSVST
jgi:hypothetical protein